MISIEKNCFDELIENTNNRKANDKSYFLKKFFPKFRIYSEDIINSMKNYFIREEYSKYTKILSDNEYDEFVYVIISGKFGIVKSTERIKSLKDKLLSYEETKDYRYIILDELNKGDVFGVYSAIKHHKNNYTVLVLSEKAEVYKIMKAHCLLYFGGGFGVIPEALKGIDSIQQNSFLNKIQIIERLDSENIKNLNYIDKSYKNYENSRKTVDESEITNSIKDAWKELENLGSKISEFKMNLLKTGTAKPGNALDVFAKMKTQESEGKIFN